MYIPICTLCMSVSMCQCGAKKKKERKEAITKKQQHSAAQLACVLQAAIARMKKQQPLDTTAAVAGRPLRFLVEGPPYQALRDVFLEKSAYIIENTGMVDSFYHVGSSSIQG